MPTAPRSPLDEPEEQRVRVKICGLTRPDEALACLVAGADWIGLNFHPHSPRCIDLSQAKEIVAAIREPVRAVGLFVNRPPDEVIRIAAELGLSTIQLHGDEPPEVLGVLDRWRIIRAFRLGTAAHVLEMKCYMDQCKAIGRLPDSILIDAYCQTRVGGTATLVADDVLSLIPPLPRMILAGGLTPENVTERVARVRPWMVDVASGVESEPGRKDLTRVAAFIRAAQAAVDRCNQS